MTDDEFRRSPSLANKMSEPVLNIETEGTEDDTNSSDTDQENELEAISHHASSISDRTRLVHDFMVYHLNNVLLFSRYMISIQLSNVTLLS